MSEELTQPCDQCGGSGQVMVHDRGDYPWTCKVCSGRGKVVSDQAVERAMKIFYQGAYENHREGSRLAAHTRLALDAAIFGEET